MFCPSLFPPGIMGDTVVVTFLAEKPGVQGVGGRVVEEPRVRPPPGPFTPLTEPGSWS